MLLAKYKKNALIYNQSTIQIKIAVYIVTNWRFNIEGIGGVDL